MTSEGEGGHERRAKVRCLTRADDAEISDHLDADRFFWLDLEDPDEEHLERLGDKLDLHPLTVEDIKQFEQRPKLEEYENYVFLVAYAADPDAVFGEHMLREVHVVVSGRYVVTIHHGAIPALADLRKRHEGREARSEQFLVYKVLDAVMSTYVPLLTRIDDEIDEIEDLILKNPSKETLERIFSLKRSLVTMRQYVTPQRDLFARDAEAIAELPGLESDDRLYFRDIYDSLVRVSDLVDSYRDLLSGAADMYLSMIANRQGEVNKQLTIIATIFLPLTFLTGFFGQNFAFLTNDVLNTTWSFVILGLGLLLLSVIGFAVFFKRKRWL